MDVKLPCGGRRLSLNPESPESILSIELTGRRRLFIVHGEKSRGHATGSFEKVPARHAEPFGSPLIQVGRELLHPSLIPCLWQGRELFIRDNLRGNGSG